MSKPTFGPREIFPGQRLNPTGITADKIRASTITSPKMGADSVGVTALADALQRNVEIVSLYMSQGVAAKTFNIFRAPPSKAKLTYVGVNCGAQIYRQATYDDGWKLTLLNKSVTSTGGWATLSRQTPSLIGQTLAATSFKSLPLNWGRSTLNPGAVLQLSLGVSGTPQTLNDVSVVIEWVPVTNA